MMDTHKTRVTNQIEHRETSPIPYYLTFDEHSELENQLDDYFDSGVWREQLDNSIRMVPLPSSAMIVAKAQQTSWTDLYGTQWRLDRRPYHIVRPALPEPSLAG